MKIIIGCSRNDKLGSQLIRNWMGTDYSHVYARWYLSSQEREIVYQASHGMVHFIELNNFTKDNIIVKEFVLEISDEQFKKFSQKCIDLAGQKYSKLQLIQIFLRDLSRGMLQFPDQPGYICSELMAELLENIFNAKFDKPRHMITPKDIVEFMVKHG